MRKNISRYGNQTPKIGKNIRLAREQRGLSKLEFGTRLTPPISERQVTNIESGHSDVSISRMLNIASVLRADIIGLIEGFRIEGLQ